MWSKDNYRQTIAWQSTSLTSAREESGDSYGSSSSRETRVPHSPTIGCSSQHLTVRSSRQGDGNMCRLNTPLTTGNSTTACFELGRIHNTLLAALSLQVQASLLGSAVGPCDFVSGDNDDGKGLMPCEATSCNLLELAAIERFVYTWSSEFSFQVQEFSEPIFFWQSYRSEPRAYSLNRSDAAREGKLPENNSNANLAITWLDCRRYCRQPECIYGF